MSFAYPLVIWYRYCMIVELKLNNSPCSVNSAYYRNKVRTQKTRNWSESIHAQLTAPSLKKSIESFRKAFKPSKHSLSVTLCFYIPHEKFYTKAGNVSRRSTDLDNCIKLLLDTLLDPRFFKRDLFNFNIDDQYVTDLPTMKRPADKHSISIIVQILDNKTFIPI